MHAAILLALILPRCTSDAAADDGCAWLDGEMVCERGEMGSAMLQVRTVVAQTGDPSQLSETEEASPEEINIMLKQFFDQLDTDNSSFLDVQELRGESHLAAASANDTSAEEAWLLKQLEALIAANDKDGSGTLDFEEFSESQMHEPPAIESEQNATDNDTEMASMSTDTMIQKMEKVEDEDQLSAAADAAETKPKKRKKNKKQKKWAGDQMAKMEKTICKAEQRSHHQVGKTRHWRSHDFSWSKGMHCSGWEDQGPLGCYRPCREQYGSGWHGVGGFCYQGCPSGFRDGNVGFCVEHCGDSRRLPALPKECDGWLYCARDVGVCNDKAVDIVLAFASFAVGLIPTGGRAAGYIIKGVKTGTKKAIKAGVRKAINHVAKKLLKKARNNLRKYIKKEGKQLAEDQMEMILMGGAEELAAEVVAEQNPSIGDQIAEVAAAIDPTGIADIVSAFSAEDCGPLKVTDMPVDGLENELPTLHKIHTCIICGVDLCAEDAAIEMDQTPPGIMGSRLDAWDPHCQKDYSDYRVILGGGFRYLVEPPPDFSSCASITVASVDHAFGAHVLGQYFNFFSDEATQEFVGTRFVITNERSGAVGKVVVWSGVNGGSRGNAHGRFDSDPISPRPGQFQVGDVLTIHCCPTITVTSVDHAFGTRVLGQYFNFFSDEATQEFVGTRFVITNRRNGAVGKVVVWPGMNGGSLGNAHGRYDSNPISPGPGQFQVGDVLVVHCN